MRAVFKTKENFRFSRNFMEKFVEYLKETKGEMKHVSWPTKEQTIAFTALVIAISLVASGILGLFDGIFKKALELFVLK